MGVTEPSSDTENVSLNVEELDPVFDVDAALVSLAEGL